MPLSTSIKYLSERGITVSELSANQFSLSVEGGRASMLEEGSGGILFTCWEYSPGPGPNDFKVAFKTLDEALLAAWYFYFGEPVGVGEWRVPMHQHPHEQVSYVITGRSP